MKSLTAVVAALLGVTMLQSASAESVLSESPLEPVTEETVRRAVTDRLRDPESAKFESLRLVTGPSRDPKHPDVIVRIICGVVNAKNSRGGYAGRTPFVYLPDMAKRKSAVSPVMFGGNLDIVNGSTVVDSLSGADMTNHWCQTASGVR